MVKGALGRHSAVDVRMQRERARTVRSLKQSGENIDAIAVVAGGPAAVEREGGGEGGGR